MKKKSLRAFTLTIMALALAPTAATARDIPPLPDPDRATADDLAFIGVWASRIDTTQGSFLDAARPLARECADAERTPARQQAWRRDRDEDQATTAALADDWQVLGRRVDELSDLARDTPLEPRERGQLQGHLREVGDAIDDQRISLRRLGNVHGDLRRFDCDVRARIDGIGRDVRQASERLFEELSEAKRLLRD